RVGFFFFQAEDGIRDFHVTGVQTCALPILPRRPGHHTPETRVRPAHHPPAAHGRPAARRGQNPVQPAPDVRGGPRVRRRRGCAGRVRRGQSDPHVRGRFLHVRREARRAEVRHWYRLTSRSDLDEKGGTPCTHNAVNSTSDRTLNCSTRWPTGTPPPATFSPDCARLSATAGGRPRPASPESVSSPQPRRPACSC